MALLTITTGGEARPDQHKRIHDVCFCCRNHSRWLSPTLSLARLMIDTWRGSSRRKTYFFLDGFLPRPACPYKIWPHARRTCSTSLLHICFAMCGPHLVFGPKYLYFWAEIPPFDLFLHSRAPTFLCRARSRLAPRTHETLRCRLPCSSGRVTGIKGA